mmetsp:Transcript_21659/g.29018  ORF Transcript_21659/g.29018 Transcript_21659/m.29018 type:complete len:293 (-) Transcript_21659:300-1178(-)
MMYINTVFGAALLAAVASAGEKKCKALVLSGGGSNGAYEAGVMWGLVNFGDSTDFEWDVLTGASVGSINALATVAFETTEAKEAAQFLSDKWASVQSNDEIYKEWEGSGKLGFALSCLTHISCYDSSPMLEWLTEIRAEFDSIKRRFTLTAVDINNGEYVSFNQTNTSLDDMPTAAVASSSIPVFFQPTTFKGHTMMDGGVIWNVNVASAVEQCLEIVDSKEDIIIDVIQCGTHTRPTEEETSRNAFKNLQETREIRKYYTGLGSLQAAYRAFPDLDWRYLFMQGDLNHNML